TPRNETTENSLQVPVIPVPEVAHTTDTNYEVKGDSSAAARNRQRTTTREDEELAESAKKLTVSAASPSGSNQSQAASHSDGYKRESTAVGILRRLSTRKPSSKHDSKGAPPGSPSIPPPALSPPADATVPRKSLSVRQSRESGREPK